MTQEESRKGAKMLFEQACEMCENYSHTDACETKFKCPVYKLYEIAATQTKTKTKTVRINDNWTGCQGNNDFEPRLKPEMI